MTRIATRSMLSVASLMLLAAWTNSPDLKTDSYTGFAYQEGTKQLIYIEEFTDRFQDGEHIETLTTYLDPQRKKIAERVLDFRKSKFAPDFTTEDLRTGYLEGAEVSGDKVKVFNRKDKNSKKEEKTIKVPQPFVVDGGFNQFIKSNWEKIENGESIAFQFVVPARLDYFTLRVEKVESTDTEMKVQVEPDKALIRWIASPIVVRYSKETHRIISYEGKSNISDDTGKNFMTRLVYPKKGP